MKKRPLSYHIAQGLVSGAQNYESPHQNARPDGTVIDTIIIHHISLPPNDFGACDIDGISHINRLFMGTLDKSAHPYFATIDAKVSAHLLIDRKGAVSQFVNLDARAWHAGKSRFLGRQNFNDFSIGIVLEGSGDTHFTDAQYHTLAQVCVAIHRAYPKTRRHIYGHEHIAAGRKHDPGPYFDWQRLRTGIHEWFV